MFLFAAWQGLLASIIAFLFGLLIIIWPKLLNYLVAIYFLFFGALGIVAFFLGKG